MPDVSYHVLNAIKLLPAMAIAGCVSLHAPLVPDKGYPESWAPIVLLGPECKKLAGEFENGGTLAVTSLNAEPVLLTNILGLPGSSSRISLSVTTRKIDGYGDSISTLQIISDERNAAQNSFEDCFCVKQTLMCKVSESYRMLPYFSVGGSQRNVYFSRTRDGALITKIQNYQIDVIMVVPVFGGTEPWARFPPSDAKKQ